MIKHIAINLYILICLLLHIQMVYAVENKADTIEQAKLETK